MNSYKKINNILGWAVFVIASAVYILTSEPTMSYWDCGEYIATAFKLEVGHPPGAPLFQLIGRFFSLFAFGDLTHVARMVNTMSALASGFTILFLFWTITMIAKKIILRGSEMTKHNLYVIMGAGLGIKAAESFGLASNIMFRGFCAIVEAYLIYWAVVYYISRKYFKFSREWSAPLASGISICGVSASIATGGAIRARPIVPIMVSSLVVIFVAV